MAKYLKLEAIRIRINNGPLLMEAQRNQLEREIRAAIKYDCEVAIDSTEEELKPIEQEKIKPSVIKISKIKVLKKRYKLTFEKL
jgi:hypothetical protein